MIDTQFKTRRLFSRACALISLICLICISPTRASAQEPHPVGSGLYRLQLPDIVISEPEDLFALEVSSLVMISGDIRVTVQERDDIQMTITATLSADDRESAIERFEFIRTTTHDTPNQHSVDVEIDQQLSLLSTLEKARIRIRLALPVGTALELEAKYLQTQSDGALSALRVVETVAPVTVSGVRGRIEINSSGGELRISNHIGALDLRCDRALIKLTDIEIPRDFATPGRNARVETSGERITFTRYSGPLVMKTSQAQIRGRGIEIRGKGNRIENNGGRIDLRFSAIDPEADLAIVNAFENVLLRMPSDLDASITLKNDPNGLISFKGVEHTVKRALVDLIELSCGLGSSNVSASTRGGGEILISQSL